MIINNAGRATTIKRFYVRRNDRVWLDPLGSRIAVI